MKNNNKQKNNHSIKLTNQKRKHTKKSYENIPIAFFIGLNLISLHLLKALSFLK